MNGVFPAALMIDKCRAELLVIMHVVDIDPHCWPLDENGLRIQVACKMLICWFHTKKAWVEHLLPQVHSSYFPSIENEYTLANISSFVGFEGHA